MDFGVSYLNLGQSKLNFQPVLLKHSGWQKNKQPHPLLALTRWPSMLMTLLHQLLHHEKQRNWLTKNWKPQRRIVAKKRLDSWQNKLPPSPACKKAVSLTSVKLKYSKWKNNYIKKRQNYKKNQRGAVYQRQLREKRIDGIQKLCNKDPGAAEILQQNSFNWTKTNRLRAEID